ncbi:hypothetical protein [Granulosicoccus antarcticus]|uniref:non-specific serine/threonine protein kinase n=1 Tax=Granulosicoccus antarcticus IMCC3135 TaxID=1192854 RepID=A0A2Z2NQW3_9GAMM|nr:hypothetical protein [Granulosicoccus antarcticus]ASJ72885.1 hypothetical protein IMCC3135_14000 [Granulosicoccus antarcticus IMCC3135]
MKYWLLALAMIASYPFTAKAQSVTDYAVGAWSICSLSDAGALSCASENYFSRLQPPPNTPALTSIVAGNVHMCGLTEDGSIFCWGDNSFGQNEVPDGEQFINVSAGLNLTCGVTTDNRALCWGLDTHGESEPPADVLFSQLANDLTTSCGLTLDGSISCWGQFDLADFLNSDVNYTKLLVDDDNACGLTDTHQIHCRYESQTPLGSDMVDLAMTRNLICGLQASGDIVCTTNNGTAAWLPHLSANIFEINRGPEVVALYGGIGETKMCYATSDGDFNCFVRENQGDPMLPGDEAATPSAPVVNADVYSDTTVELTWGENNTTTGGADIYRDGQLLDSTSNGGSYIDNTMTPGIDYAYSVATYSDEGVLSSTSNPIIVNSAPGEDGSDSGYSPAYSPFEPTGLTVKSYSSSTLELFWDRPGSLSSNFHGYEIRRNNTFHAFTRGISFYDIVEPGESYHYDVVAVSLDGSILGFSGIDID